MDEDTKPLGEFLRAKRAMLHPQDVGLRVVGHRRSTGLRRQDLAHLAGISLSYYTRLEQGRAVQPSATVLNAIASALRLDDDDRLILVTLARHSWLRDLAGVASPVRPELVRLVVDLGVPALLLSRGLHILSWNTPATQLFIDFGAVAPTDRNLARLTFLDPRLRTLHQDWHGVAQQTVGWLKLGSVSHPNDAALAALIGELCVKSEEFRRWWAASDLPARCHGRWRLNHPGAGAIEVHYEAFSPADSTYKLIILNIINQEPVPVVS